MAARIQPLSNADISQAVLRELGQLPLVDVGEISVKADNGVVTVAGLVKSRAAREAAERAVEQVRGVRAIASDLEIRPFAERTDTQIAKDVLSAFQSHAIMSVDAVRVIVCNGHVRLEGSVRSQFERLLAEAAAKAVRGLRDIENNIHVKPGAPSIMDQQAAGAEEAANNDEAWPETGAAEAG